jgi:hypothetical protein
MGSLLTTEDGFSQPSVTSPAPQRRARLQGRWKMVTRVDRVRVIKRPFEADEIVSD